MTALTDELKAAFIAAAGWQDEPWRFNAEVADGLAAASAAERQRIREALSAPFLAAIRCVPDGRIQNGCVVHDGKTVRERAKQAYLNALDPAGRP